MLFRATSHLMQINFAQRAIKNSAHMQLASKQIKLWNFCWKLFSGWQHVFCFRLICDLDEVSLFGCWVHCRWVYVCPFSMGSETK
jgi:hypothetical protein